MATTLHWFDNHEDTIYSWDGFKAPFAEAFGKPEHWKRQAWDPLLRRYQIKEESATAYIEDVLRLCRRADPQMTEDDKVLRAGVLFNWTLAQQDSFNTLKKTLTFAPILGHFIEGAGTEIRTGASGHGTGAVLVQVINDTQRVIAYASRTLTKSERNFSTTEKECLAVIWEMSKFRPYLYGSSFRIVTGHHAFCWFSRIPRDPLKTVDN
ncbi:retrovirus-related Pol polyprotein from transposon 412 [Ixodes scapularis]